MLKLRITYVRKSLLYFVHLSECHRVEHAVGDNRRHPKLGVVLSVELKSDMEERVADVNEQIVAVVQRVQLYVAHWSVVKD